MSEPVIPPPPPSGGSVSENRSLMIVLAYLWILFLVPLLVEKDDREVQWHGKHGMVLTIAEIILYAVIGILSSLPVVGCVTVFLFPVVGLLFLVVRVLCIIKGTSGERYQVPMLSQYVEKF